MSTSAKAHTAGDDVHEEGMENLLFDQGHRQLHAPDNDSSDRGRNSDPFDVDTSGDIQYPGASAVRQGDRIDVDVFGDNLYPSSLPRPHADQLNVNAFGGNGYPEPSPLPDFPGLEDQLAAGPQGNTSGPDYDPNDYYEQWWDEYTSPAAALDAGNSDGQQVYEGQMINQGHELQGNAATGSNFQWPEGYSAPARVPDFGDIDHPHVNEGRILNQGQNFDETFASGYANQGSETSLPTAVLADVRNTELQHFNEDALFNQAQHSHEPLTSGNTYAPQTYIYNNSPDPRTYNHQQHYRFLQDNKRQFSAIDDTKITDEAGSQPQAKKRKLATPSRRSVRPTLGLTQNSPMSQQDRKRKNTQRTPRKGKVQCTKGREHHPKGIIWRDDEGRLGWRMTDDDDWEPAGYHHEYREELIAADLVRGQTYDQNPAGGKDEDPLNITSYCAAQRHWTDDKSTILDERGRQIMHWLDPPDDWVANPKVGRMMFKGMVMIDKDDIPVREFRNVPNTLSTHIEAFRLEGLRRCTGMTLEDIRARMPLTRKDGKNDKELQTSQAFTNRTHTWRTRHNIGVWLERDGSQQIKDFIKEQLPDPNMKSTENLAELTPEAQKAVRDLNKGKFGNKSRYEQKTEDLTAPVPGTEISKSKRTRVRRNYVRDGQSEVGTENTNYDSHNHHESTARPAAKQAAEAPNSVSSPQAQGDIRLAVPWRPAHAASIQAVLYYTQADFAYWVGEAAPRTPAYESYIQQYMRLQEELRQRWDPARGAAPDLVGVWEWFSGWDIMPQTDASEEDLRRILGWSR